MDGDGLDALNADEDRSSGQALIGANLEFAPLEGITLFGRIDGGFNGKASHHEEKSSSLHWFAGLRVRLGGTASLEAGWRYYRVRTNREADVPAPAGADEDDIFFEVQRNELVAQGPWLGIVFDF
jgi:hypothetical protein